MSENVYAFTCEGCVFSEFEPTNDDTGMTEQVGCALGKIGKFATQTDVELVTSQDKFSKVFRVSNRLGCNGFRTEEWAQQEWVKSYGESPQSLVSQENQLRADIVMVVDCPKGAEDAIKLVEVIGSGPIPPVRVIFVFTYSDARPTDVLTHFNKLNPPYEVLVTHLLDEDAYANDVGVSNVVSPWVWLLEDNCEIARVDEYLPRVNTLLNDEMRRFALIDIDCLSYGFFVNTERFRKLGGDAPLNIDGTWHSWIDNKIWLLAQNQNVLHLYMNNWHEFWGASPRNEE